MSELSKILQQFRELRLGELLPEIDTTGLDEETRELVDVLMTVCSSRNDLFKRHRHTLAMMLADADRLADTVVRIGLGDYTTTVAQVESLGLENIRTGIKDMEQQLRRSHEEQHRLINEVRNSEERFRQLVESSTDWIWEVDKNGIYVYSSPQVENMLGYTPEEIIGHTPFDLMPDDEAERVAEAFAQIMKEKQSVHQLCNRNLHKNGTEVVLESSGSPFFDESGEVIGYRGIDRDVTKRKVMEEELRFLAAHDPLTGLNNRHIFQEQLTHELERAQRYERKLSLLMMDIDHFKHINDRYGHPAGDEVLKEFAGRLQDNLRQSDFIARYGGEEFVVLLPETDVVDAHRLAERIREAIAREPFHINKQDIIPVTASVGLAAYPGHAEDGENLVSMADGALYEAKNAGRNQVRLATVIDEPPMQASAD